MAQKGVWIVNWDIPTGDKRNRAQFYYELKKLRKEYGMQNRLGSQSMLVVESVALARAVHNLALKHGKSCIWWAIPQSTTVET